MNLHPGALLFGVTPTILLNAVRELRAFDQQPFSLEEMRQALTASTSEAIDVARQMQSADFIRSLPGEPQRYLQTKKFGQLCMSKISAGIPRAEADTLVEKIVDRATAFNARATDQDCRITCVVVFGSYLTDKPILGDLDIGVALTKATIDHRLRSDESIPQWSRRTSAPEKRAFAALRLRKPNQISVHSLEEVRRLNTPYRVVFGEEHGERVDFAKKAAGAPEGVFDLALFETRRQDGQFTQQYADGSRTDKDEDEM